MGRFHLNSFLLASGACCLANGDPTSVPTSAPTLSPTLSPTLIPAEYEPGNLNNFALDMYLSKGLAARIIATAQQPVTYSDGTASTETFHTDPDGAAIFEDENTGEYVYASNSEALNGNGGVGALKFDADGNVIDYRRVLSGTSRNCNGGKTDWNAWISCEESLIRQGKCWQVDPFGVRESVPITLGSQGGTWEAFAHDTRNASKLVAFITEDEDDGRLSRMTINDPSSYADPWDILLANGDVDYLVLEPNSFFERTSGTFRWTTNEDEAKENAESYYPASEGMKMDDNILRVVSKSLQGFFELDLDALTYTFEEAAFDGQPDQSITVSLDDGSKLTYFTEEAHPVLGFLGAQVGLYSRDEAGEYTTIIFGDYYSPETTGIAFSPNGMHMYFAYQTDGILFDVTRTDGLSFFARTAPVSANAVDKPESTFFDMVADGVDAITDWLFPAASKGAENEPFP